VRGLDELPSVGNQEERESLEGGRPSRVLVSGMLTWKGVGPKGKREEARGGAPLMRGGPTLIFLSEILRF
jgi:hypothetical protein